MDSPDDPANDPRDVLEKDPRIAKKLLGYAYKKTQHIQRAKDAAQEAVARMLEGKGFYRWNPKGKSLLNHLADIVDTVVANETRSAAHRHEVGMDPGDLERIAGGDPAPNAREQLEAIEDRRREALLAAAVMARVQSDPIIPRMLDLEQQDVGDGDGTSPRSTTPPSADVPSGAWSTPDGRNDAERQARLLGCTVKDIYRARERLAYHRDKVLEEEKKGMHVSGAGIWSKAERGTP
jgi:DNA-directed RNA polymerase specialized sigma24 family protein